MTAVLFYYWLFLIPAVVFALFVFKVFNSFLGMLSDFIRHISR